MGLVYHLCVNLTTFVARNVFRFQVYGRENIPNEGPTLLAMNHQSFLDPPLAAVCCEREIHFLARKTLFDVPFLGKILRHLNVVGVDRDGADMSALKSVIRILKTGGCTIIFPEGTRTSDGSLGAVRGGVGFVVAKTFAPVVPMRIFGAFDALPRTAKFPRRASIRIVVGQALQFSRADVRGEPRDAYQAISEKVMAAIGNLQLPR